MTTRKYSRRTMLSSTALAGAALLARPYVAKADTKEVLIAEAVGHALPPVFVWWRGFATRYVGAVCLNASGREDDVTLPVVSPPDAGELASLVLTAPMMAGAEYLTPEILRTLWQETAAALATSLAAAKTDLQSFLKGLNPAWNLVGRVHFNLAENRRDDGA